MNTYYHEFLLTILPDMIRIKAQCGSGVVVTREPSKLKSRVRFPSPVPIISSHTELPFSNPETIQDNFRPCNPRAFYRT